MSEEPSDRRSASALPRSRVPLWAMVLAGCGCAGILAPVVLAWLLVPVIHKATADAREQLCVSNVKTLALGFRMYAADYDGCLPIADMWTDATAPYVGHQGVLACPSANAMERDELGYAFNSHLGAKKLARWATPATVVLLFDSSSLERNAADAGHQSTGAG